MIIQSPESAMPEPYKTYVRQRSETIAKFLSKIVGEQNVQLCPRAITPEEVIFHEPSSVIYGAVVRVAEDGLKSVLYRDNFTSKKHGVTTNEITRARNYALGQLSQGNRIRVKDATESDGKGQKTIESLEELDDAIYSISAHREKQIVIMPHLENITERISVGRIALGKIGDFEYFGREEVQHHDDSQVYGGTTLGLFPSNLVDGDRVLEALDISPDIALLGVEAIKQYQSIATRAHRVSVDVIQGFTDNGSKITDVVDITPRVGGTTPAEILAIREVIAGDDAVCFAKTQLIYAPKESPKSGVNFIDTQSLVINADVLGVMR